MGTVIWCGAGGVVFSEAMPSRRYSAVILAGSWPSSSGDDLRAQADAQAAAATKVRQAAGDTRDVGERFMDATEGRFAAAMYEGYRSIAGWLDDKADFHDAAHKMYQGIGGDVDAAKSHLEHLDWQAHDTIEKLEKAGPVAQAEITAIVGGAHAACVAHATETAAHIAGRQAQLAKAAPSQQHPKPPGSAYPGRKFQESPYIKRDQQGLVKAAGDGDGGQPVRTGPGGQSGEQKPPSPGESADPAGVGTGSGPGKTPVRGEGQHGSGDTPGKGPLGGSGLPGFTGVGSGGGPGSGGGLGSGGGSGGGLGSGLLGGGSPLSAFQSGLGAGSPGAGLATLCR